MQRRGGGPKVLIVLIAIIFVTLCGPGATIAVAGGASAAATNNGAPPQTCGETPDQPQCEDNTPGAGGDSLNEDGRTISGGNADAMSSGKKEQTRRTNEDEGQSPETRSSKEETTPTTPSKFNVGDVIELYNTESMDIQIVFPSIVKGIETSPPGGYRVTKTTDGKEVRNIPEKYLHIYKPYKIGAEVLCNIGEFKKSRPIIVRCTVLDYEPATPPRGALVLQGNYRVQVHETKANPAHETTLPVWKLQRRYLASG